MFAKTTRVIASIFRSEDMQRFGVDEATIASATFTPQFRELMQYQVNYARQLFAQGCR